MVARERAAGSTVVTRPASTAALATVQGRIARYVATHGTRYSFASYTDPDTGEVIVKSDAPAAVVASLTRLRKKSSTTATSGEPVRVKITKTKISDDSRRSDTAPYYGGAGILGGSSRCSAGYTVRNAAGARFMVTAGHCYTNGTAVTTELDARPFGTVSDRALGSVTREPLDMELISGQTYSHRIFIGGVDSTTSLPVLSAGNAQVKYSYCHSGRTSGEQCGHMVTATDAQVCTSTGCKQPMISYMFGVISQPGDSGAPFYAKDSSGVYIRGHVTSHDGDTGYVEPWAQVATRYGVSIATS